MAKRNIILYTASSLDGFIAKEDGNLEWLEQLPNPDNSDYGYHAFYQNIDTTLMGYKTFEFVKSKEATSHYAKTKNFVFTRQKNLPAEQYITFINDPIPFTKKLKGQPGKDIWLVGGGEINSLLLTNNLIDQMIISVIPIILGNGLRLFPNAGSDGALHLTKQIAYTSGIVTLYYEQKKT